MSDSNGKLPYLDDKLISRKKPCFPMWPELDRYLRRCERSCRLSLQYEDLMAFSTCRSMGQILRYSLERLELVT